MSKELEVVEKLLSFAFAMSENMIGLTKGNYDEKTFIKKTYGYLLEYSVDRNEQKAIEQSLERLEAIDNAIEICKKANEQKYVYIKETYGIIKSEFLDDLDYEILNNRLYVNSRGIYYNYPLKDYGNWWALTKEELENE